MTGSSLKRDSNDHIKVFDRDEWLLKRQRGRTTKLLDLDPELQKAKDKISLDEHTAESNTNNRTSNSTGSASSSSLISCNDEKKINGSINRDNYPPATPSSDETSTDYKTSSTEKQKVRENIKFLTK